jgi:2-isopropylmalate synthase
MVERRHNALGRRFRWPKPWSSWWSTVSEIMSVAEGNGPVNALDMALRKDLGKYQSEPFRISNWSTTRCASSTAVPSAITRVLIESRDGEGERWFTIGVSPNIVDASFEALMDSVTYKLMKNRDMAGRVAAE